MLDDDLTMRLERAWNLLHRGEQSAEAIIAEARKGQGGAGRWWCSWCSGFSKGPEHQCSKCRHVGAVFSEEAPGVGGAERRARLRAGQKQRKHYRR